MEKGENYNHPKPGSEIRVDPLKDLKSIQAIKRLLADKPRDLCLFVLGINSNLRASDLIRITAGQVRDLKPMDEITIIEKKTKKLRRISLNKSCILAIKHLLASREYQDNERLFIGKRGPLSVGSVNRLVKGWCKALHLKGNFGSHTLRKTWGYHQRVSFGASLPELMTCFNHSSQRQTLDYLCIQPEEIRSIYANEL